jgi:ribosome-binding protein aMBF1 (putative translation factor)
MEPDDKIICNFCKKELQDHFLTVASNGAAIACSWGEDGTSVNECFPHSVQAPFAKLVKIKMLEKDLTRADLAQLLGVKHNTLSGWFNGKHFPLYQQLPKLARILDISLVELLTALINSMEEGITNHERRN